MKTILVERSDELSDSAPYTLKYVSPNHRVDTYEDLENYLF